MSITTEQAAAWFENRLRDTPMKGARAMFEIAAAALREKAEREDPRPLTLAEFRDNDFPFWVCIFDQGGTFWPAIKDCVDGVEVAIWCGSVMDVLPFSDYGETWIAYCYKPKEAQG